MPYRTHLTTGSRPLGLVLLPVHISTLPVPRGCPHGGRRISTRCPAMHNPEPIALWDLCIEFGEYLEYHPLLLEIPSASDDDAVSRDVKSTLSNSPMNPPRRQVQNDFNAALELLTRHSSQMYQSPQYFSSQRNSHPFRKLGSMCSIRPSTYELAIGVLQTRFYTARTPIRQRRLVADVACVFTVPCLRFFVLHCQPLVVPSKYSRYSKVSLFAMKHGVFLVVVGGVHLSMANREGSVRELRPTATNYRNRRTSRRATGAWGVHHQGRAVP